MQRTLITFITLFICQFAFGQRVIDLKTMSDDRIADLCKEESNEYGKELDNYKRKVTIHQACLDYIDKKATPELTTQSNDGATKITAGIGMIKSVHTSIVKGKEVKKVQVITGTMSNLQDIESIALSSDKKWIAVLQKVQVQTNHSLKKDRSNQFKMEKEILLFMANLNGNVSPQRILRNSEINSATSMAIHPKGDEIYISNNKSNSIVTFSTTADFRMKDEKKRPNVIRRFTSSESSFREPASITFMDDKLLILDASQTHLYALNPMSNTVEWSLDKNTIALDNAAYVKYSKSNKKLVISDKSGNSVEFDQE